MMTELSMVGTFSKHPRAYGFENTLRVVSGDGVKLRMSDGAIYIDWVCGLGSNLLGYGNPIFNAYLHQQIDRGAGFSLPHYIEDSVAFKLAQVLESNVPGWNGSNVSVRFAKTGSEANAMAVRIARAATKRSLIVHCGYGGWFSEFIAAEPPAYGIPEEYRNSIVKFSFGDDSFLDAVRGRETEVAAVMLEQGAYDAPEGWYASIYDFCHKTGALFILDEVVTGLRFDMGGAAQNFGIFPDMVTMGKGLANGFAVSAVAAPYGLLNWFDRDDPVFCSSTHWGEAVSLTAAHAMLNIWDSEHIGHIWHIGLELMDGLRQAGWNVIGHPPRSVLMFEDDYERAFFVHGMRGHNILMNRPNFISFAHNISHVNYTVSVAEKLREEYESLKDKLPDMIPPEKLPHVLFKTR